MSYKPSSPRFKPEEATFFHYDLYFVQPGKEDEAWALCKEFVALFKAKNIANPYRIFTPRVGYETPAIFVEVPAKDAADYYGFDEKDRAALGEEGRKLFAKAFAISRRIEHRNAWLRPDLSVRPAAKK